MHVLFTGLGSIGRRHLRLLRDAYPSIEVSAFRSGKSERERVEGVTEYTSLDSALGADPDVAFVTNPTALHVETALRCGRAGCDLFVEKPLSHSLDGIDELIDLADERDLVTYVGCQFRFDPVLRAVRSRLVDGSIGSVNSFRAYSGSYLPEWRPEQDYRESYSADPSMGGGVVLDLIHEIDYSHWLFGPFSSVSGHAGQVSNLTIDSNDIAEIVVTCETEAVGSIHLDYTRRDARRDLEVIGDRGVIEADLLSGSLTVQTETGTETENYDYERDERFRRQLAYFVDHVQSRTQCENDFTEAKQVLQVASKVR